MQDNHTKIIVIGVHDAQLGTRALNVLKNPCGAGDAKMTVI